MKMSNNAHINSHIQGGTIPLSPSCFFIRFMPGNHESGMFGFDDDALREENFVCVANVSFRLAIGVDLSLIHI